MSWRGMMLKSGISSDGRNINIFRGTITARNFPTLAHRIIHVDSNNGSDTNSGNDADHAKATIQAAVTIANSADYATKNVDILVYSGYYTECIHFSRGGTGLGSAAMLWAAGGGGNIGLIGTIRLIAVGTVFLVSADATTTQPTISVSRPNVEIHNFAAIRSLCTETVTKTNWTSGMGNSPLHVGMPVICFDGEYNADDILYGAAANCKVVNCLINAGGIRGGILNYGCNWIDIIDTQVEYGSEYGVAIVGSAKGSPAENVISGCRFQQNTAVDILHGNNFMTWVKNCDFVSEPTKYLAPISPGGASAYCTISDCVIVQPDLAELIPNAGWQAINIHNTGATTAHTLSNDDLAS